MVVKYSCTRCLTFLTFKEDILGYTCSGRYAHLEPRKYPLEIFFIHGHFSADLKYCLYVAINDLIKPWNSNLISFHSMISFYNSSFLMEIIFFTIAEKNSLPGPMKHVFLWILWSRPNDIGYFSEHFSVKTINYTHTPLPNLCL